MGKNRYVSRLTQVLVFAIAMAYCEAAVVVYLRELYYPGGFAFPLKLIPLRMVLVELGREAATLVMLVGAAALAGRRLGDRFGYFLVAFGVWDIFYYIWLKVTLGWPASLLDWDILFLIPLPWIGPVLAPCLVAAEMIIAGVLITRLYARGRRFLPTARDWVMALIASGMILYSFMRDTAAGLWLQAPQPYRYSFLVIGLVLYAAALADAYRRSVASEAASALAKTRPG